MTGTTRAAATGLTPKRLYRVVAIAEAITWTLLIVALIYVWRRGALDWK